MCIRKVKKKEMNEVIEKVTVEKSTLCYCILNL